MFEHFSLNFYVSFQISFGDGLPSFICHRCLFKVEFCLEFRQLCFISDATLRQIHGLPFKPPESGIIPPPESQEGNVETDVVMVVDPATLDYESDFETDTNEHNNSDNENETLSDLYESKNVSMCRFCDQAFTDKTECSNHESNAHNHTIPYACNNCEMGFADRLQYSAHLKSVHQNEKPYNCPQCHRTFARRSDLRKHTIVHTGVKPFTCNVCFKSFSRNTNLSKHMRIHSGRKPFVCPKCPKTFISKGDLTRHSVIHSGQKPFSCNYCHLSFGRKDKLLRHEKRHLPEGNYEDKSEELQMMRESLSFGDYSYAKTAKPENEDHQQSEVKQDGWTNSENMVISLDPYNHDMTPHPEENGQPLPQQETHEQNNLPCIPEHITGDSFSVPPMENKKPEIKRYPCLTCHKRFSSFEGLRLHSAVHSGDRPHVCSICTKAFMRKRELDRHMATHTGMRPFKCTNCEKSFGRKDKLVRHMRIHDINREHVCAVCGASFNRKDGLTHHMKTHAKEELDVGGENV